MGNKEKEQEFYTETIKKKPVNIRKIFISVFSSIGLGILGGIVAIAVFVVFLPMVTKEEKVEETGVVYIPKDVEEIQEPDESEEISEEVSAPNEVTEVVSNEEEEVIATEEKTLTLKDYKELYRLMGDVADEALKSVVTVASISEERDWFKNPFESTESCSGLFVADNGKELLIITNDLNFMNKKEIEVTFHDGRSYPATLKKSDSGTGLCVLAVEISIIDEKTMEDIKPAELGNSNIRTIVGSPVMAIGSPMGVNESMSVGIITSNNHILDMVDSNVKYLTTDIYANTTGSGVLIDLDGRVLGVIFNGNVSNDLKNFIHAYAISDIKGIIEKLSNGQDFAYFGIKGTDVTIQAQKNLGVPEGAYVTEVSFDSPAMQAGIQNGDIIVKIGTNEIKSFKDFKDTLIKFKPEDSVTVTCKRGGREGYQDMTFDVVFGKIQ